MCSYCNTSEPDKPLARKSGPTLSLRHGIRVTNAVLVANALFLAFAILAESLRQHGQGNALRWMLTGTDFGEGLVRAGAYHHVYVAEGQWWRVLAAVFLHSGLLHIGLNTYSLISIGRIAEELF